MNIEPSSFSACRAAGDLPTVTGCLEVDDPCAHECTSKPWELMSTPLDRGPFGNRKVYLVTPSVILYRESFRTLTRLRGISPAGMLGFCLPMRSVDRACYWGKTPRRGVVPGMLPGGLDVLMDAGQTHVVVLIGLDLLRRGLPEDGFDALTLSAANRELPMSPADAEQLAAWLLRIIASAQRRSHAQGAHGLARLLEEELPWRLSHACLRALDAPARPDRSARRLALDRAIVFLRGADPGSVTVGDLCNVAGVKQRTLEYGFKEGLGLSPLRFVRLLRLHAARRALAASEPGEATVGDIAMRFGLLHQSRFASEYGALFGEMPSRTLSRSKLQATTPLMLER